MTSKATKGEALPAEGDEGASSSAAPPEPPRPNAEGESRIQVGEGERIEPAQNPATDGSRFNIDENPGLDLWPHPQSLSDSESSSPKCGCCARVSENCNRCCCCIL